MKTKHPAVFVTLLIACAAYAQNPPSVLVVEGAVEHRLELRAADLEKMPRASATFAGHDKTARKFEGVLLIEILRQAGASLGVKLRGKALAQVVVVEAEDGYRVAFALAELDPDLGNKQILVADRVDGHALESGQGPWRLIVPGDSRPARSARMIKRIQVIEAGK